MLGQESRLRPLHWGWPKIIAVESGRGECRRVKSGE